MASQPDLELQQAKDAIITDTLSSLRRMRDFRLQYDARRAYFYRQYMGQRDARLFPDNLTARANTFVPYARSQVETVVGRVHDAFFSIYPPIETMGVGETDQAAAPAMQVCLLSGLHRAKWVKQIEKLVRNICIYGHAGIKVDWDFDWVEVTAPEPVFMMVPQIDPMTGQPILGPDGQPSVMPLIDPNTGQPLIITTQLTTKQIPRACPKLIPIDVFDLLVDPDGGITAHVMEKSCAQLMREAQAKPDLYLPGAIEELIGKVTESAAGKPIDDILIRMAETWNEIDNTVTLLTFGEDASAISYKDLRYSYRNANYSSYKRKVYTGAPILLQYGANPFLHKRNPILHTSYTQLTGEPFGVGVIEPISELNESLNKMCNMITDNWNLAVNRRYVYNVDADIDHNALNNFNVPGGKVGVSGNPNDVIMPLPVMTPTPAEFSIMELYKQQIELASGISDFYNKGVGGSGGNRTATGIGQVMTESNFIFKMFISNLELDVLQPLMEMCASNIQQFCSDYVEYQVTDAPPNIPKVGRVPVEKLLGSYSFDFVAANYATNKVVRQRNMMSFYQLAQQTPYANQGAFLHEIGKVMDIPNCSRLVKPDAQVMQEQAQMQQTSTEMAVLEKLMDTESKMLVAAIAKKDPNSVTAHASEIQKIIETILEQAGELSVAPPQAGPNEGRPGFADTPGQGQMGAARSTGQQMGANALGLGGLGEAGGY